MRLKSKKEIENIINNLGKDFQGYIQYSHRKIDKNKDVFIDKAPVVLDNDGFIYEAHFSNGKKSISIRQINSGWIVNENDISNVDEKDFDSYEVDLEKFPYKIKMAQIWMEEKDEFCEGLIVNRLKAVVFAGFEKGEIK